VRHLPPRRDSLSPGAAPLPTPRPELEPTLPPHEDYIRQAIIIGNHDLRLALENLTAPMRTLRITPLESRPVLAERPHASCPRAPDLIAPTSIRAPPFAVTVRVHRIGNHDLQLAAKNLDDPMCALPSIVGTWRAHAARVDAFPRRDCLTPIAHEHQT
jgi:hypothetical protein